jgi:methionyl-tRNA formyltransferase
VKLVLLADGFVGANITNFLLETYPEDVALVVTTSINEIYQSVKGKGIPVCIFDSEKNIAEQLDSGVDLGVLAWWPKILKSDLLDLPKLGFVNTHPSLLPHNRGKNYNFWALVEQSPFGVTIHRADSGVDSGDIVAQESITYDWCDTGKTLYKKAQLAMLNLFRKTYPSLRIGRFNSTPQDTQAGSFHYASELEFASKIILDKQYRARDLLNLLRARTFDGHPSCWFEEDGIRYEISVKITKDN